MVMYCLNINCKEETSPQQKMKLLSPPSVHIIYKYSEWAKPLQCNTCHVIRYMCNICAWTCVGQRTCNSYVRSRLARHHKWHNLANKTISSKNKRSATDVASLGSTISTDVVDDHAISESINDDVISSKKVKVDPDVCVPVNVYDREESNSYYQKNASSMFPNEGPSFLVGNALTHIKNSYKYLSEGDITLHLMLSKLTASLTRYQRIELAYILELLEEKFQRDYNSQNDTACNINESKTLNIVTNVPTSENDLRVSYLRGKYAIMENLPRPKVILLDNHSYVSIRQCIADFLSNDKLPHKITPCEINEKCRLVTESLVSKNVLEKALRVNKDVDKENLLVILAVQWHDDFEPNSSSKANRGSVWMKTVTFISTNFSENKFQDTYPISIGLKGECHDVVETKFIQDCEELRTGKNNIFYSMKHKKNMHIHFEVIVSLGDQPARREINYLMQGNSKFLSRYRFAADILSVSEYLPACQECYSRIKSYPNYLTLKIKCEQCVCWNMMNNSPLMQSKPPNDYPLDAIPTNGKLQPQELTFSILNSAIDLATKKLVGGHWSELEVHSYCGANGISVAGIKCIIKHANNIQVWAHYQKGDGMTNRDDGYWDKIYRDREVDKAKYEVWGGSPYWNGIIPLNQFVDTIMHLLFLGITKASRQLIHMWITESKRIKSFNALPKDLFGPIGDMGLDWCKLLTTTTSGWVSESYLAFSRVIKWYYYPITTLQPDKPYVEPTIPLDTWYVKMCRDWLIAHGCDSKGYVKELKERIDTLKHRLEGPPVLLTPKCCSVSDVNTFIGSLLSTIASVMEKEVTPDSIISTDREIKLYLSSLHRIQGTCTMSESDNNMKRKKPYWLSHYNFMSLLNLPEAMKMYGPLTNLWEGANQGEGYLRYAKPKIIDIHSKNWQLNAHVNLLNLNSLNLVVDCYMTKKASKMARNNYSEYINMMNDKKKKMYFAYKSVNELFSSYRRNMPISCIRYRDNVYYAIIQNDYKKKIAGVRIDMDGISNIITSLSMVYHGIKIDLDTTDVNLISIEEENISKFILLLPELCSTGYIKSLQNNSYYIIDSEWNELDEHMNWNRPKSPGSTYDVDMK